MIRSVFKILIVFFLVAVAIAAYQVQGFVEFRFLGIASKVNIGEFFLALLVLLVVLFYFLELLRFLSRLSSNITRYWRKRQKKEAERYLGEAVSLMESESYDEAFRKIRRAREVLKDSVLVKWVYARLVVALGAFDEAVVSELLSSESLVLAAHRLKIERLLKQGNYTDVVEHAVAALKINPSSLWFLNTLFSVYVRLSELDKALDLAKKMSGHGHSSAAHKMALCYFLLSQAESDVSKKIKQLELAVDLDKTSANITAELAAVYINMGKHKKAQEVIEKVWKHTRSSFLGERFLEAVSMLNSEERLSSVLRLLDLAPASIEGYIVVVKMCLESEFLQKARYYLEKAIQANQGMSFQLLDLRIKITQMDGAEKLDYYSWMLQTSQKNPHEFWECSQCGLKSHKWSEVCVQCEEVSSYRWQGEHEQERTFFAIQKE